MARPRTADAARGKWKGILLELGIDGKFLSGKHGPCPMCGGKDRARFDNKGGNGTFICSQCGNGDGFEILKRIKGWDFKTAAKEIDKVVGNVKAEPVKAAMDENKRRELLNALWKRGSPIRAGDPVEAYLKGRGLPFPNMTGVLRYAADCPVPYSTITRPAMLALVADHEGNPANLHRTFLGPNGKADMEQPRAMMPGAIPEGSAVRLAMHGDRLGIAEGIETAISAWKRFGIPTWAAINSAMLAKWKPPASVKEVVIFGDNDPKFGGAAAAYALAHKLAVKGIGVDVRIPAQVGLDWADRDAA